MPDRTRLPAPAAALLALAVLALAAACSLDYGEGRPAGGAAPEIPDTVMTGFTHTVVSAGRVWVKLSAQRAEGFDQAKRIELTGVRFEEYDDQGRLVTEAVADRAVYHTDTEDAEVSGGIRIRAPEQRTSLAAESLSWIKEGRRLSSDAAQSVRLQKEDGSFLEGRGFRADFRRQRLEFSGGAGGSFVEEEDAQR